MGAKKVVPKDGLAQHARNKKLFRNFLFLLQREFMLIVSYLERGKKTETSPESPAVQRMKVKPQRKRIFLSQRGTLRGMEGCVCTRFEN